MKLRNCRRATAISGGGSAVFETEGSDTGAEIDEKPQRNQNRLIPLRKRRHVQDRADRAMSFVVIVAVMSRLLLMVGLCGMAQVFQLVRILQGAGANGRRRTSRRMKPAIAFQDKPTFGASHLHKVNLGFL